MRHPGSRSEVILQAARGSSPPLLPPIRTRQIFATVSRAGLGVQRLNACLSAPACVFHAHQNTQYASALHYTFPRRFSCRTCQNARCASAPRYTSTNLFSSLTCQSTQCASAPCYILMNSSCPFASHSFPAFLRPYFPSTTLSFSRTCQNARSASALHYTSTSPFSCLNCQNARSASGPHYTSTTLPAHFRMQTRQWQ